MKTSLATNKAKSEGMKHLKFHYHTIVILETDLYPISH